MEVAATSRWVRTTARKARLVAATVEGLPVAEALTLLKFTPRAAAVDVAKVIKSAAANAEHNYDLDGSSLRVARIDVDGASIIKRFRPRAQGRAFSIFKRTVHLRATVVDDVVPRARRSRVRRAESETVPQRRQRTAEPSPAPRTRGRSAEATSSPKAAGETTTPAKAPRRRRGAGADSPEAEA